MVNRKQEHYRTNRKHYGCPGFYDSQLLLQYPGKVNKSSCRQQLGNVVGSSLPANVFGLQLR